MIDALFSSRTGIIHDLHVRKHSEKWDDFHCKVVVASIHFLLKGSEVNHNCRISLGNQPTLHQIPSRKFSYGFSCSGIIQLFCYFSKQDQTAAIRGQVAGVKKNFLKLILNEVRSPCKRKKFKVTRVLYPIRIFVQQLTSNRLYKIKKWTKWVSELKSAKRKKNEIWRELGDILNR